MFTGYLIVDRVTGHLGSALLLTLGLFILALCVAPIRGGWLNAARVLAAVCMVGLWLGVAALSALFTDFGESRYVSPDGRSVLVVTEGAAMIDPLWTLTVRQPSWLVARSWEVGCFNGDDPNNALESVRWTSATELEATDGSGRKYLVTIDPSDARPARSISAGCDY